MAAHHCVLLVWPGGGGRAGGGGGETGDPPPTPPGPENGHAAPAHPTRQSVLGAHAGRVNAVAFRPCGEASTSSDAAASPSTPTPLQAASAGADRCVRLWDARTRRCVASASKLKADPVALAWAGPGLCALGCADGALLAWRVGGGGGREAGPLPGGGGAGPAPPPKPAKPAPMPGWTPVRAGVTCLAVELGRRPSRLAAGCGDGSVWVVDCGCLGRDGGKAHASPAPPARLWSHAGPVQSLAWGGGGRGALASGGADGRVVVGEVGPGARPPTTLSPSASAPAAADSRRRWTAVAWVPAGGDASAWWLLAGAGPAGGRPHRRRPRTTVGRRRAFSPGETGGVG